MSTGLDDATKQKFHTAPSAGFRRSRTGDRLTLPRGTDKMEMLIPAGRVRLAKENKTDV